MFICDVLCFLIFSLISIRFFFFFNDTATTEIYTLSLHDALPICRCWATCRRPGHAGAGGSTRVCWPSWPCSPGSWSYSRVCWCCVPRARRGRPMALRTQHQQTRERSEEHTSEIQSPDHLVCRLLL